MLANLKLKALRPLKDKKKAPRARRVRRTPQEKAEYLGKVMEKLKAAKEKWETKAKETRLN